MFIKYSTIQVSPMSNILMKGKSPQDKSAPKKRFQ